MHTNDDKVSNPSDSVVNVRLYKRLSHRKCYRASSKLQFANKTTTFSEICRLCSRNLRACPTRLSTKFIGKKYTSQSMVVSHIWTYKSRLLFSSAKRLLIRQDTKATTYIQLRHGRHFCSHSHFARATDISRHLCDVRTLDYSAGSQHVCSETRSWNVYLTGFGLHKCFMSSVA